MDIFAIMEDELDKTEEDEGFYICEDCREKHLIERVISEIKRCDSCFPDRCSCPKIVIGFYKCKKESYLYSINGKQIA